MPRGGNHRRLRAGDPYLDYAHLLLDAMQRDDSPAGEQFRRESDALYLKYRRLLAAIVRYPVSGWAHPGPPPLNFIRMFFETLLLPMPVPHPRYRTLPPDWRDEAMWRRGIAEVISLKVDRARQKHRSKGDFDGMRRFTLADRAAWNWALSIERECNPGREFRESGRMMTHRYLADVAAFCSRWRLIAEWADIVIIDYHFMRLRFGAASFLPLINTATWEGDDVPLVVAVPGADPVTVERDRELMTTFSMLYDVPDGPAPVRLNWQPDQDEQRRVERERGAACVVIRWDGHYLSGRDSQMMNAYAKEECAARRGRALTKAEAREIQRQLDPQIRDARAHFQGRGWQMTSDAPLREHATWLARRLLTGASWNELATACSGDRDTPLDARAVRRACSNFASAAHLRMHRTRSKPAHRA